MTRLPSGVRLHRRRRAPLQIPLESPNRLQQFAILRLPKPPPVHVRAQFPHGRQNLSHAHLRRGGCQVPDGIKQFLSDIRITHRMSPTRLERLRLFRNWPATTTGTVTPGANVAIRVARVTPSKISNKPSGSSYTSKGGIPSLEIPNCRICRCNFHGSAPEARLGGSLSSAGSASRTSPFIA